MVKKLQNVQTGPKNSAKIRTDSLFTDTLLRMQSTNDCSKKQDGVHLQVTLKLLPPRGFRQEAKSRGGTLVTRAYIKDSNYSSNIQSVY